MCVCVCVCVYICMCIYIYTHTYMYTYTHIYTYTYTHIYTYAHIFTHIYLSSVHWEKPEAPEDSSHVHAKHPDSSFQIPFQKEPRLHEYKAWENTELAGSIFQCQKVRKMGKKDQCMLPGHKSPSESVQWLKLEQFIWATKHIIKIMLNYNSKEKKWVHTDINDLISSY